MEISLRFYGDLTVIGLKGIAVQSSGLHNTPDNSDAMSLDAALGVLKGSPSLIVIVI